VAVLRRGPSAWSHLGRWDLRRQVYEPGAWIRGNLYPQRCDLSPDGQWFTYLTLKGAARWKAGGTYVAISRLPWLTALAAWGTSGTWTRGIHFVEDLDIWQVVPPDEGDAGPGRRHFGIVITRPASYAVERRRGWTETPDSPKRQAGDMWDEARASELKMEKPRPGADGTRLVVQGDFAAFRESHPRAVHYQIVERDRALSLDGVQWADWDAKGRLLLATTDGRLQIRKASAKHSEVVWEIDVSDRRPDPKPAPAEAHHW